MIRSGIYTLGIIVLTGILVPAYAQPGTDTTWKRGGNIGINLSQVSLSQWAAGGDNAVGFNLQFNYFVQTTGPYIPEDMFRELGISKDDQALYDDPTWEETFAQIGLNNHNAQGKMAPIYHLPLTKKMYDTLSGNKKLISKIVMEPEEYAGQMYPLNLYTKWNRNNYGPIWIPAKGATITLTEDNLPIYERCIVAYEGNKLEIKPDGIYINGEKTDQYTFKMDYYWMMGDNRDRSLDSRYWGLVPEDHIVGSPAFVVFSVDDEKGLFGGGMRWNRILSSGNPGKHVVNPEAK